MILHQEDLRSLFHRHGLALTHQRQAVYEALSESREHPTAEALFRKVRRRYPTLSLATVYKSLQALQRAGLACMVDTPGAETRYDAVTRTHHHAVCEGCGRISDIFDPALDRLRLPASARGFRAQRHSVQFHGLCVACDRTLQRRKNKR